MPHYCIFDIIGVGALSCLTTSILTLRKIVPHYGILVRNGDGGYMLSDHFYSAPSGNYAPLWYNCHDWGGGIKLSDHFYSAPSRNYAPLSYIVMIVGGGYRLSDHFYSAPSRNYAPLWYI